jgi:hypothetical protein
MYIYTYTHLGLRGILRGYSKGRKKLSQWNELKSDKEESKE